MDEFQINEVLNDSFDFSEIDNDILNPDFLLPGNNDSQNDVSGIGILELSDDDCEKDLSIPVGTENIERAASTSRIIDTEVIIDNELEETNELKTKGKKRTRSPGEVGEEIFPKCKEP